MARSRRPKPGVKEFNEGIYHRPPVGLSFFKTGVLALIVLLILSYFAYTKELPWSADGYTATATFADASTLRETAPVRIAGVNVGKVTNVEADGTDAKVTFTVDRRGAAAARRRADHDPPAAVPRGQLLPRPPAGQPERARPARRRRRSRSRRRRPPFSSTRC